MKARVGVASAAIAVLTVSGIKSALPGVPMGPDPSEGRASQVRVAAVVDGDTLHVEELSGRDLGRVRLLGIDAPEVAHPPAPAQCYAEQAADLLDELAPVGSTVRLLTDSGQADTDRYDRLLRYVDHAGVDVAHELLARGAARYEAAHGLAREESYSAAADRAQDADSGLWGTC